MQVRIPKDIQRNQFVIDNQALIYSVVNKYRHIAQARNVEVDDLVQAGNVGLLEAYATYDEERGAKLSTYAYYQIRSRIQYTIFGSQADVTAHHEVFTYDDDLPTIQDTQDFNTSLAQAETQLAAKRLVARFVDDKHERHLLTMRLVGHTLAYIGNMEGMSRQRVDQKIKKTIARIKKRVDRLGCIDDA